MGDLLFNVVGEGVEILAGLVVAAIFGRVDAVAPGIGELNGLGAALAIWAFQIADDRNPVPGDTRGRVDNGHLFPGDHVQKGTFADIGSAHDSDTGDGHGRG